MAQRIGFHEQVHHSFPTFIGLYSLYIFFQRNWKCKSICKFNYIRWSLRISCNWNQRSFWMDWFAKFWTCSIYGNRSIHNGFINSSLSWKRGCSNKYRSTITNSNNFWIDCFGSIRVTSWFANFKVKRRLSCNSYYCSGRDL